MATSDSLAFKTRVYWGSDGEGMNDMEEAHKELDEEKGTWDPIKLAPLNEDPHGKDQHDTGAKLDAGKPRMSLVVGSFARAITEVAKVGTFGAEKYTADGWKDVPNGEERYTDAMLRHYTQEQLEYLDSETGLPHAAAVAWNSLARLELMLRKLEENKCKGDCGCKNSTPK